MIKKVLLKTASLLPYDAGSRLIRFLAVGPVLQRTLFRRNLQAMTRLKAQLDLPQSVSELTRRHIIRTEFDPWRIGKLGHMDKTEFDRWVRFRNLDQVQAALTEGQGVLFANTHVGMARFLPLAMKRKDINVTTLEADPYYKRFNFPGIDGFDSIELRSADGFYLKAMFAAKKVLKKGGALLMAPDGLQGMGDGDAFPFLEKKRNFFSSFTGLAKQTKAKVFIGLFEVDDDGHIEVRLELCGDFARPETEECVVLEQYIQHLEDLWKDEISSVQGRHLMHYLTL